MFTRATGHRHLECWLHQLMDVDTQAALADPYFAGLSQPAREPSAQPVSKLAFEFERRKLQVDDVRPGPYPRLFPGMHDRTEFPT